MTCVEKTQWLWIFIVPKIKIMVYCTYNLIFNIIKYIPICFLITHCMSYTISIMHIEVVKKWYFFSFEKWFSTPVTNISMKIIQQLGILYVYLWWCLEKWHLLSNQKDWFWREKFLGDYKSLIISFFLQKWMTGTNFWGWKFTQHLFWRVARPQWQLEIIREILYFISE